MVSAATSAALDSVEVGGVIALPLGKCSPIE